MKKIILLIAVPFIIASFFYLIFAFGSWEFNPGRWDSDARVFCAIFIGGATICIEIGILGAVENEDL